ncbi:hypothetical protein [Thalassoroseus pseudoceratinae]|uniref:hypothetical protein n=1 Tax=Thalassoroseus pseudoceratinae TaxID=2713176 RepID=UPI001421D7E2|nr:hypothetical protein [Thalassoroseus pseudoceratinae]
MQRCPECDEPVDSDAINMKEGVALCEGCRQLIPLSELRLSERSIQEILDQQPIGCMVVDNGFQTVVTTSLRSISGFITTTGIALFWNGIVSVFVLVALAGLYSNLIGPVPEWFPAPGVENGQPIMNDEAMGLGTTLFLCVFLIPFVTIGIGIIWSALLSLIGRVDVVCDGSRSHVATGIPIISWKRRFNAKQVREVVQSRTRWQSNEGENREIKIVADQTIKFGAMLSESRMEWMCVVLKEILLKPAVDRYDFETAEMSDFPETA